VCPFTHFSPYIVFVETTKNILYFGTEGVAKKDAEKKSLQCSIFSTRWSQLRVN
jgi:hypothetical protein